MEVSALSSWIDRQSKSTCYLDKHKLIFEAGSTPRKEEKKALETQKAAQADNGVATSLPSAASATNIVFGSKVVNGLGALMQASHAKAKHARTAIGLPSASAAGTSGAGVAATADTTDAEAAAGMVTGEAMLPEGSAQIEGEVCRAARKGTPRRNYINGHQKKVSEETIRAARNKQSYPYPTFWILPENPAIDVKPRFAAHHPVRFYMPKLFVFDPWAWGREDIVRCCPKCNGTVPLLCEAAPFRIHTSWLEASIRAIR